MTEQILDKFQERLREPACEYDSDEDEIEPTTTMSTFNSPIENVGGALKRIEELRIFLSQQKDAAHLITPLYDVGSGLCEMLAERSKQTSILDFFFKVGCSYAIYSISFLFLLYCTCQLTLYSIASTEYSIPIFAYELILQQYDCIMPTLLLCRFCVCNYNTVYCNFPQCIS